MERPAVRPVAVPARRRRPAPAGQPRRRWTATPRPTSCIVGAGYTGLWTAYYLRPTRPVAGRAGRRGEQRRVRRERPQRRLVLGAAAAGRRGDGPPARARRPPWPCARPWWTPCARSATSSPPSRSTATSGSAAPWWSPATPPSWPGPAPRSSTTGRGTGSTGCSCWTPGRPVSTSAWTARWVRRTRRTAPGSSPPSWLAAWRTSSSGPGCGSPRAPGPRRWPPAR